MRGQCRALCWSLNSTEMISESCLRRAALTTNLVALVLIGAQVTLTDEGSDLVGSTLRMSNIFHRLPFSNGRPRRWCFSDGRWSVCCTCYGSLTLSFTVAPDSILWRIAGKSMIGPMNLWFFDRVLVVYESCRIVLQKYGYLTDDFWQVEDLDGSNTDTTRLHSRKSHKWWKMQELYAQLKRLVFQIRKRSLFPMDMTSFVSHFLLS